MRFSGLPAWLLWRGIYLWKLPGPRSASRVLLDWTIELVFPETSPSPPPSAILQERPERGQHLDRQGDGHRSAARAVAAGAPAGIVGGLAFGAAMANWASCQQWPRWSGWALVRAGFAVHMAISALVGAGFG